MHALKALLFATVAFSATFGEPVGSYDSEFYGLKSFPRSSVYNVDDRTEAVAANADMKSLHGQAVSDPACCTAGVHLTFCFVRWVDGFVYYRRVGVGETWKSLGQWIVGGVTCVAHGTDVMVIINKGSKDPNPPLLSNTISNGKPLGWKPTHGTNAREVPGCTVKKNELYCMYRGPKCGAYLLHTVKGVWQPQESVGGKLYSPIAAWYTRGTDELNFYGTNIEHHMQAYQIKAGVVKPWRQRGKFVVTGRPSVCSHGPNIIDIFSINPGSNLLWLQRTALGRYLPWKIQGGGQINYNPTCVGSFGKIDCFGVSPKHELQRKVYRDGKWEPWTYVAKYYVGTPSCHFSIAGVNIISCYVRNALTMGIDAYAFIA